MRSRSALAATAAVFLAGSAAAQRPGQTQLPQLPQLSCETRCQIAYNNCIQQQQYGPSTLTMCMQIRSDCIRVCPRRPANWSVRPGAPARALPVALNR